MNGAPKATAPAISPPPRAAATDEGLSRRASRPGGSAPIGRGPRYELPSLSAATRLGRPLARLTCRPARAGALTAHVELFAAGRVLILPAGVGIAPPRERDVAYVRGGRCRYPLWTTEPTGLVDAARPGLTLGDLFAVWGQPLSRARVATFAQPVRAFVAGRPWRGDPRTIPLIDHAQVVVEAGAPLVAPHAAYRFPDGR
jgi:hypothetical protein